MKNDILEADKTAANVTDYANVVVIRDDAIVDNLLISGSREDVAARAEAEFRAFGKRYIPNWDTYTAEDIDACLDGGIAEFGNGFICISWPQVRTATT